MLDPASTQSADNFCSRPSCGTTLEYTAVSEQDIAQLEQSYQIGTNITLYGIGFEVVSYSYKREGHILKDSIKFSVYSVTVELGGLYQNKVNADIPLAPLANSSGVVTISQIASAAGVPLSGAGGSIKASEASSTSLSNVASTYSRLNGCYISYINGVHLQSLSGGSAWNFSDSEIVDDGQNKLARSLTEPENEICEVQPRDSQLPVILTS